MIRRTCDDCRYCGNEYDSRTPEYVNCGEGGGICQYFQWDDPRLAALERVEDRLTEIRRKCKNTAALFALDLLDLIPPEARTAE